MGAIKYQDVHSMGHTKKSKYNPSIDVAYCVHCWFDHITLFSNKNSTISNKILHKIKNNLKKLKLCLSNNVNIIDRDNEIDKKLYLNIINYFTKNF